MAAAIRLSQQHSCSFAPGSIFALVRWASNDYGTVASRIDILRAVRRGERYSTISYVCGPAEKSCVLPTIQDAVREARATRPDPNITLAARQITQLAERCKTISKPDPLYCAVAAYHGPWDRPDTQFADAVRATVEKGNAPNFDIPKDAYFDAT